MFTPNLSRDETIKELKRLKSESAYDTMLATAQKAVLIFPDEGKIWELLHYAQAHYVNEKLESKIVKQLEERKDYTSLATVYIKLLSIFPESDQLKKLLRKTRQKIQEGHEQETKAYYESARAKIEEMIKKNDYESAIQATYEILDQNPENKFFFKLLVKAQSALDNQMNKELAKYYEEVLPALEVEYKEHKDQFIRI